MTKWNNIKDILRVRRVHIRASVHEHQYSLVAEVSDGRCTNEVFINAYDSLSNALSDFMQLHEECRAAWRMHYAEVDAYRESKGLPPLKKIEL